MAKPGGANGNGGGSGAAPEAAFDLWLRRGLHDMFDDVMREPIPDELLRLIEEDKGRV
ncbi:NepR family anti-sigma factor [Roseomonas sp. CCTCC AB2023176]|uniref:NepR family anti-sigma factor n=1 Tax=Roseomonas sp. CCTCC AB2023176 TaxID=3342640 RepID=UPI0035D716C3